jgi:hypothetical protein
MPSRAAEFASRTSRSLGDAPEGWVRIVADDYPLLFEALTTITHDSGGGADHDHCNVPLVWACCLPGMEAALEPLTDEQRWNLAIGEQTEVDAFVAANPSLTLAHQFLNAFFEDFPEGTDTEAQTPQFTTVPAQTLQMRYVQRGLRRDLEFRTLTPGIPSLGVSSTWGPWATVPLLTEAEAQQEDARPPGPAGGTGPTAPHDPD